MLGQLLEAIGVAALKGEITAAVNRLKLRVILTAVAAVLWLLVFAFALAALTAWLATAVGAVAAAAIIAAVFVAGAIGVHVALVVIRRRSTPLTKALSNALAPLKAAAQDIPPGSEPPDGEPGAGPEAQSAGLLLALAAIGYALGRYITRR